MDWPAHIRRILERLGEDAEYRHEGRAVATVRGIFTDPSRLALSGMLEGTDPSFSCMREDVPDVAHGDTLVLGGTTYKIRKCEPDRVNGTVALKLEARDA